MPAVFAVAAAVTTAMVTGGWGWLQGQWSDPPGLTVHAALGSCPVYTDKSLDELRQDPSSDKLRQGVAVTSSDDDPADLALTLQAKTSQAIVVTGVTVRRLSAGPVPRAGSIVNMECGGSMSPRVFDVDLMATQIRLRPVSSDGSKAVGFPLKVSDSDPEQLSLKLLPGSHDVRFSVEVNWISEGEAHSETVADGAPVLRVTGPGRLPVYSYAETFTKP
ncbi:hypothetical protein ABZY45_19430 [Streptomyces sp. NPDC006516]|uniref:hypothetical protein n=1 Tax=Streptomyces sp. NPDC006516 TaxID=3154309 RepID=UPI0033A67057